MTKDDYGKAGREAGKWRAVVEFNSLQAAKNAAGYKNNLLGYPVQPASRTTKKDKRRETWKKNIACMGRRVSY